MSLIKFIVLSISLSIGSANEVMIDPIIQKTIVLDLSIEHAFQYFIDGTKLEEWLTVKADVELKVGGKYELFWEPETPEDNSTIGCKILAYDAPNYLIFDWKGPVQFKSFMNTANPLTQVSVIFIAEGGKTKVTLIHSGWREGDKWNEARLYFEKAWNNALSILEKKIKTS